MNEKEISNENSTDITTESQKNKKHFSLSARILFWAFLLLLLIAGGTISLTNGLKSNTDYSFFYSESSNLDYKVCLKANEYFTEECLDKNKQYVASLIETINADFKYVFSSSDLFNYKYIYYATARLVATEKNDPTKVIYDETETITEEQTINMTNSNSFTLIEPLEIDYKKYNSIMTNFRKDYTLLLDSKIIITLHVKVEGNYEKIEEKIVTSQDIVLSIPLSEQTINISMDYKDINNSNVVNSVSNTTLLNILFYIISGISFIMIILVGIRLGFLISKTQKKLSLYQKTLNKILREYDQIIINSKNIPNIAGMKITEVESFEELLDVRNVLQKPIVFVKIHSEKCWFLTSEGNEYYRYEMKAIDLENDK